ncbi:MAG: bifunctional nuclease family protein [Acidimicrobiales bacterium]
MGTDEDAVEADLGSASMTRANDDGPAFVDDDLVATESATWTSDVAEVAGPAELGEPAELEESAESAEPAELGEPAEQEELDEPDDEMDLAVDPLVTPPDMSQMLYVDVVLLLPATYPVVVLQEADPPFRELRIPVGGAEGIAIGYAARGLATPRPLTHELFTRVLEEFGMTLDVVRITEVRGTAFDAEMVISGRLGARLIDCRPSDAIALALRQQVPVPIMAASAVLEVAGTDPMGAN